MKFANIIFIAGLDKSSYPHLAQFYTEVFDRKDRMLKKELVYTEPIFSKNINSLNSFRDFLENGEKSKNLEYIKVKITDLFVIIHSNILSNPILLRR